MSRGGAQKHSGFVGVALLWGVLTLADMVKTLMWSLEWNLSQVTRSPGNSCSGSSVMLGMGRGRFPGSAVTHLHSWPLFIEKALAS